jgi:outer membrane protein
MKSSKYLLAAGALLALAASPAFGYEAGTWVLRAGVGVVAPDSDNLVINDGIDTTTIDVDDGTSLTLMGTYMFTPNWGFDVLASWPFNHDINVSITDNADPGFNPLSAKIAETDHLPPTFSIQYHFLPDGTLQPYVGAGLNYTTFFNTDVEQVLTDLTGVTDIDLDDSFGLALQLGADWTFGNRWLLNFDLRWIDIESDLTVSDGVDSEKLGTVKIDPWVYSINIGYSF